MKCCCKAALPEMMCQLRYVRYHVISGNAAGAQLGAILHCCVPGSGGSVAVLLLLLQQHSDHCCAATLVLDHHGVAHISGDSCDC